MHICILITSFMHRFVSTAMSRHYLTIIKKACTQKFYCNINLSKDQTTVLPMLCYICPSDSLQITLFSVMYTVYLTGIEARYTEMHLQVDSLPPSPP